MYQPEDQDEEMTVAAEEKEKEEEEMSPVSSLRRPYHVERCEGFIKSRVGPQKSVSLVGSFKAYITGLKYHRYVEKPSKDRIYLCLLNPDNKFDPNTIGIYANQSRIGYAPRDLCGHVSQNPQFNLTNETVAMLCYCLGRTTENSSQCVYNIFQVS